MTNKYFPGLYRGQINKDAYCRRCNEKFTSKRSKKRIHCTTCECIIRGEKAQKGTK